MHIHVCRHAEAEAQAFTGRDFDRPLTRQGQLQARYLASLLSHCPPENRPRRVVTSPAVRALQTAQTIADELGLAVTTLADLLPACHADVATDAIERHLEDAPLLMVGHNPTVTAIVSILLHGPSAGVHAPGPALRTGQMATLAIGDTLVPGECRLIDLHRYEPAMAT